MHSTDSQKGKRVNFSQDDQSRKKHRAMVVTGKIMVNAQRSNLRHMPLDLDNGLPGIVVRLGTNDANETCIHTHIDTCAAMSTGNLLVHQWFITTYPECVAEYIQYDDADPFEPIKLSCAIEDLSAVEALHGKLTAIVRYHTRYVNADGTPTTISFGLGQGIAVNSIIGLPTLRQWGMNLCLGTGKMIAPALKTRFDIEYENAGNCLPKDVVFKMTDFVRPNSAAQPLSSPQASIHAILDDIKNADAELVAISDDRNLVPIKDQ